MRMTPEEYTVTCLRLTGHPTLGAWWRNLTGLDRPRPALLAYRIDERTTLAERRPQPAAGTLVISRETLESILESVIRRIVLEVQPTLLPQQLPQLKAALLPQLLPDVGAAAREMLKQMMQNTMKGEP